MTETMSSTNCLPGKTIPIRNWTNAVVYEGGMVIDPNKLATVIASKEEQCAYAVTVEFDPRESGKKRVKQITFPGGLVYSNCHTPTHLWTRTIADELWADFTRLD